MLGCVGSLFPMIQVLWDIRLCWISVSNGSGVLDCEGLLGEGFAKFQRHYNPVKCCSMTQHHIPEDLNPHCMQVIIKEFQEPQ